MCIQTLMHDDVTFSASIYWLLMWRERALSPLRQKLPYWDSKILSSINERTLTGGSSRLEATASCFGKDLVEKREQCNVWTRHGSFYWTSNWLQHWEKSCFGEGKNDEFALGPNDKWGRERQTQLDREGGKHQWLQPWQIYCVQQGEVGMLSQHELN